MRKPDIDLADLRAKAEAAKRVQSAFPSWSVSMLAFQKLATPTVVLALLDRLAAAEAERDHLEFGCAETFVSFQARERTGDALYPHQLAWLRAHERYFFANEHYLARRGVAPATGSES